MCVIVCGAMSLTQDGRTPLLQACWNGHKDVVEMLLRHPDIDVNKANNVCVVCPQSLSRLLFLAMLGPSLGLVSPRSSPRVSSLLAWASVALSNGVRTPLVGPRHRCRGGGVGGCQATRAHSTFPVEFPKVQDCSLFPSPFRVSVSAPCLDTLGRRVSLRSVHTYVAGPSPGLAAAFHSGSSPHCSVG